MLKREPYIDLVIGPQAYHKINDKIEEFLDKQKRLDETEFDAVSKFDYLEKIKNSLRDLSRLSMAKLTQKISDLIG